MLDVPPRAAGSPAGEPRPSIRTVLVDDSFLARAAIKHLLAGHPRMTVVGECEDAKLVPETVDEQRVDVLITDIRMPPLGHDQGVRLAARLRETPPCAGGDRAEHLRRGGIRAESVRARLRRTRVPAQDRIRNRKQLVDAIKAVLDGGSSIDPAIVEELVRAGAIAERLVLTKRAVEKHVNAIFAKLELGDPDEVSPRVKPALLYLADRGEARLGTQ